MTNIETMQPAAPPRRSPLLWPGLIVGLLVLHVAAVLTMVLVATRDRSFAIEPDFYQKGLHWDQSVRQREANARLGWRAALAFEGAPDSLGRRTLVCRLQDAAGRPIDDAAIDVVAFSHARAATRTSAPLTRRGPGQYEAPLRVNRGGLWEFRLAVRRGPDVWTCVEQQRLEDR